MTQRAALIFYVLMFLLFGTGILAVLHSGQKLEKERITTTVPGTIGDKFSEPVPAVPGTGTPQLFRVLIQLLVVVGFSRVIGFFFQKIGQPEVMGEIAAGIILGPSLIGALWPAFSHFVFPPESLHLLKVLSKVGILFFMFQIGMDLDLKTLKTKVHSAVVVSHAGILVPYFLGVLISLSLFTSYAPDQVKFVPFALFMGIAMSITAFPVMARILEEKKLSTTPLGMIALACAAADDVTAWSILAGVVAIATAKSPLIFLATVAGTVLFIFLMLFVLRPFLRKSLKGNLGFKSLMMLLILAAGAFCTERIGIHALFGAFLAGVICPQEETLKNFLNRHLNKISFLLMPLFFAFTGLRTQVGLLNTPAAWGTCLLIIGVATLGKFGGSTAAARYTKMNWPDALSLGALMNTRGLMELIVLNIGYDLGILTGPIFAMMILMALVTTLMTGPLLSYFKRYQVP